MFVCELANDCQYKSVKNEKDFFQQILHWGFNIVSGVLLSTWKFTSKFVIELLPCNVFCRLSCLKKKILYKRSFQWVTLGDA